MGEQGGGGRRRQERKGNQTGRVMAGGGLELWQGPQSPARGGTLGKGIVGEGSTGWVVLRSARTMGHWTGKVPTGLWEGWVLTS